MKNDFDRSVSAGTIVMLSLALIVLVVFLLVVPGLMRSDHVQLQHGAMDASVDLKGSVRTLRMKDDIPIAQPSAEPGATVSIPDPDNDEIDPPVETPLPAVSTPVTATPEPAQQEHITLTFGGSIVVNDMIRKSGYYSDSKKYDHTDTLALIADFMDSDITLVTLESITDPNRNVKTVPNAPDSVMDMLEVVNVDLVAIGYNQAFDYGLASVEATIREARNRNLTVLGAFATPEDAAETTILTVHDVQIAYLHYTMGLSKTGKSAIKKADAAYALPTATITDYDNILSDIRCAREAGASFVIVSLNWSGAESNADFKKAGKFLQAMADGGADAIIGAGTKTVKPVTWLTANLKDGSTKQTLCALSLGSLLNGRDRVDGNVAGMLLHIELDITASGVQFADVTYTPTYIWRYEQDDQFRYRVVASNQPAPDAMDENHIKYAEKAFSNLTKYLGDSPISPRAQ